MYVVLLGDEDRRFLGGSARSRNLRVIERVGAATCSLRDLASYGSHIAMLVPSSSALMLQLFSDVTFNDAIRARSSTWLDAADGASVLIGTASALAEVTPAPEEMAGLPRRRVGANTLLAVDTAAARRRSTRAALRATEKASDGWVSRNWNRPISRTISRAWLAGGLSAHAASRLTLAVGLICAWAAAQPGYWMLVLTGVLFHLASVLDGVDGEVARATLTESAAGARLDTLVDQITYAACFVGSTVGWIREGGGAIAAVSAVLIGGGLVASLLRGARFVSRHGVDASFVVIDRSVNRAARESGRLPLRIAAASFALLRRDLFAVVFLAVSLTGVRALVPILLLAGIVLANLTLSVYGHELADAARAERAVRRRAVAGA